MVDYYYKYRSLSNLKRFVDILINRRLYATHYSNLNDPMEGFFQYAPSVPRDFINTLRNKKSSTLICSLSQTFNNGLMWSVYSDEHKGCCIKLSVTSTTWHPLQVSYAINPATITDAGKSVEDILKIKSIQWAHEKEVRFIKTKPSAPYVKIKIDTIYLGMKISRSDASFFKKLINTIAPEIKVKKLNRGDIDFGFVH